MAAHASAIEETLVNPVDTSTLEICWYDQGLRGRWTLSMARGTKPPASTTAPIARVPAKNHCHEVHGLQFAVPYTFTIVVHRNDGGSVRANVTAATRRSGQWLWTRSGSRRTPHDTGFGRILLAPTERRLGTAALFWRNRRDGSERPYVATISPRGVWSRSKQITDTIFDYDGTLLAGNTKGDLAVAWQPSENEPGLFRLRPAGSQRWSAPTAPFGAPPPDPSMLVSGEHIHAIVLDDDGRLHLLVIDGSIDEADYVTNATGQWTRSPIRKPWCPDLGGCSWSAADLPLMAYDPVTDRLVLAEHHYETRVVDGRSQRLSITTFADKPAAAAAFGPPHEAAAASTRYDVAPVSLSARGGQLTLALARWGKRGRPSLMTGDSPEAMQAPVHVPGTTAHSVARERFERAGVLAATAASRSRVVVAFQRDNPGEPSWNRRSQGIWIRDYVRDPSTGAWRFGPARRVTTSAYDRLDSLSMSADGPVIGYRTY